MCSILAGAELDERGQSQVQKNPAREKYKKKKEGTKNLKKEIDQPFTVSLATKSASSVEF